MTEQHDWKRFFDGHAPEYNNNVFTKGTEDEVAFLLQEFGLPPGAAILDMGCGTGRHSVALARAGYQMTGVDLSDGMLAEARKAADKVAVDVAWIRADATAWLSDPVFDAAMCVCEGAFGLLGQNEDADEHDERILSNILASLKPGGRFVLTCLSAFRMIRAAKAEDVASGRFDPLTLSETNVMTWETAAGPQHATVRERGYVPAELARLLRRVGFDVKHVGGGTAGQWGHRTVDLDEYELMAIAAKP
jgi:SAM-dependent methyltransferase